MFVKLGARCNIQDLKGNTPLHVAVGLLEHSKNQEIDAAIKALLVAGADPKLKNKAGLAPIHTNNRWEASKESLSALMSAGASLESRTDTGRTVLLSCLENLTCHGSDIQTLLDLGADVHARDFDGRTVLHYCSEKDKGMDFLTTFVDAGVDPSICDYAGNTLFHQAARTGPTYRNKEQLATLEKILELGIDPRAVNHAGQIPLHIAVGNRIEMSHYKTDPIEFLLSPKCNVDINASDHLGIRAIHLAAALGESQIKQLLEKGANSTVVTLEGQTPLHIASRTRQCNALGFLTDFYLKQGKARIIDQVDEDGRTALHYAVRSGRPESVAILISLGDADPNVKDNNNVSPLGMCTHIKQEHIHWARSNLHPRQAYIAAAGVTLKDPYRPSGGYSMEGRDSTSSTREVFRFLVSHGADASINFSTNLRNALETDSEILIDDFLNIEKNEVLREPVSGNKSNPVEIDWWDNQDLSRQQFHRLCSSSRIQNTDFLEGMVTRGQNNLSLFESLLSKEHEKGILKMKDLGADMLKPDQMGKSCLTILMKGGYASLLKHFGEEVMNINEDWIRETEKTHVNLPGRLSHPILIASQRFLPNLEVLEVLVGKFGVDVNVQIGANRIHSYDEGKTALHIVASCKYWWHTHALKYLLENGADPNIQDKVGNTPLHIAVQSSSDIAVSHLLSHGADPNLLNNYKLTPLTDYLPSSSIISLLVSRGALGRSKALHIHLHRSAGSLYHPAPRLHEYKPQREVTASGRAFSCVQMAPRGSDLS